MKVFIYLDTGYEKTTHDMCDKAEICKNQNSDLKKIFWISGSFANF